MKYKYPRTPHFSFSQSITSDDKVLKNSDCFLGKQVVVTIKMDGENTTFSRDYIHARSLDSRHHDSRNWVKNFWNTVRSDIPENLRICGENLYAKHSIFYDNLPTYFMGFSVWIENLCVTWEDTKTWFEMLGIENVPVLYIGEFSENKIKNIYENLDLTKNEGIVVRNCEHFMLNDFGNNVAKMVRPSHVTSDSHWNTNWEPNKLASNK